MQTFIDTDHAGELTTRRSRTGFVIYLNSAPIYWFYKRQGSVETSSFGSEFITMKQCCEYVPGLCYIFFMMTIPIDPPTYIFGDNQFVLVNTSKPRSIPKKKSASISFQYVRECIAKY